MIDIGLSDSAAAVCLNSVNEPQRTHSRSALVWSVGLIAIVVLVAGIVLIVGAIDTEDDRSARLTPDTATGTLPPGSSLPPAQYCADIATRDGSDREAVPENRDANLSVPTDLELPLWPDYWAPWANRLFVPRIDGQYTGTTDQIIVWGACKWGFSTDVVRAMAMTESSWKQETVGDYVDDPALCVGDSSVPCPTSFGLLQLNSSTRPGSWPDSQTHTAFNVDYGLAYLRGCFEGWVTSLVESGYTAGDLSGCLGWHFSGEWNGDKSRSYVVRIQRQLDERNWRSL